MFDFIQGLYMKDMIVLYSYIGFSCANKQMVGCILIGNRSFSHSLSDCLAPFSEKPILVDELYFMDFCVDGARCEGIRAREMRWKGSVLCR